LREELAANLRTIKMDPNAPLKEELVKCWRAHLRSLAGVRDPEVEQNVIQYVSTLPIFVQISFIKNIMLPKTGEHELTMIDLLMGDKETEKFVLEMSFSPSEGAARLMIHNLTNLLGVIPRHEQYYIDDETDKVRMRNEQRRLDILSEADYGAPYSNEEIESLVKELKRYVSWLPDEQPEAAESEDVYPTVARILTEVFEAEEDEESIDGPEEEDEESIDGPDLGCSLSCETEDTVLYSPTSPRPDTTGVIMLERFESSISLV
jgi:hypothetical protein